MAEQLAIIDRIISEHHAIRHHVKLAGDSLNDMEALFSLQETHSGWAQTSVENLSSKKLQLQQALSLVNEGYRNHFVHEEKAILPLFGEALTKAFIFEHGQIIKQIEMAKTIVAEANLEGLNQKDKLSIKSRLEQVIGSTLQLVEQHMNLEEQIFSMIKKALAS